MDLDMAHSIGKFAEGIKAQMRACLRRKPNRMSRQMQQLRANPSSPLTPCCAAAAHICVIAAARNATEGGSADAFCDRIRNGAPVPALALRLERHRAQSNNRHHPEFDSGMS
ncbi:MAG: hypothetical protein AB7V13_03715 [Pseudorhodoplanes sp.]